MYIEKEELLELLERKFGDLNNECGCYLSSKNVWLSISAIVEIIEECETWEDDDF